MISAIDPPSRISISLAERLTFFQAQAQAAATQMPNSRIGGASTPTMASSLPAKIVNPVTPAIEMPR